MCGDLLQVAKPEPRCLRQRGSIRIPALNDELTPDWCPGGALTSSKKPPLKKNKADCATSFTASDRQIEAHFESRLQRLAG